MTDSHRMVAGLLLGLGIGVLSSAILFKGVAERRSPDSRSRSLDRKSEESPPATELVATRKQIAELQKKNEELERRLAALDPVSTPTRAADFPKPGGEKSDWRGIARRMLQLREKLKGRDFGDWPPEAKTLELDLIARVAALGAGDGLTLDESIRSPHGLPALAIELLEQSDPPPDPAEIARLREILLSSDGTWKDYLTERENLSRLEQRRRMVDLNDATLGALLVALTPAQSELVRGYKLFDLHNDDGPQTWTEGSHEKVTRTLTEAWSTALKLDSGLTGTLQPLVDDYIRRNRTLNSSIWNRRQAGEDVPRREEYLARLALMIETHQQIAATVPLNAEQSKALKEWATLYGCNVYDSK